MNLRCKRYSEVLKNPFFSITLAKIKFSFYYLYKNPVA